MKKVAKRVVSRRAGINENLTSESKEIGIVTGKRSSRIEGRPAVPGIEGRKAEGTTIEEAAGRQPQNKGEQSVSGTTPAPSSDDDTLKNAHDVGEQTEEDEEHPKEIDIGRDIDKAEEKIRTS